MTNQNKPGYKHTPLGWIPEEWSIKEFGRFASASTAKYVPSTNENRRCIELEHINQETGSINGYISSTNQKSTKNIFKKGQVLFGKLRPYLKKYWLADFDGVCSSEVWVLQANSEDCCNEYLFRLIQQHRFIQVANVSSGSKMPRADWDFVAGFPFALPTSQERKKIAGILSTWDEAINKAQQLIAQLQQRNKGLMQQLLTARDGWIEKKVSDIFERVVRKNTNGSTNVITISAQRGFVKQNDFFKKLVASETLDNYFLVRKGEFCYNKSYSNGYDWGATKRLNDFNEAVVTTLYICFRIKDEKEYSGDYFEYFFDANILDKGLAKIAHEGGRAHGLLNVTPGDFFSLKINLPTYDEQIRIFKILSAARNELRLNEQKLAALQQQKKGLMQKLLTGEVRVKI